jgi:hypothetical protein
MLSTCDGASKIKQLALTALYFHHFALRLSVGVQIYSREGLFAVRARAWLGWTGVFQMVFHRRLRILLFGVAPVWAILVPALALTLQMPIKLLILK